MNSAGPLTDRSKKELAELARRQGVRGWDAMSKEELLKALSRGAAVKTKPVKVNSRLSLKTTTKTSTTKVSAKAIAKSPPKPTDKDSAKPTTKSAAKNTKPAKLEAGVPPTPIATRATTNAIPTPTVNGTHGAAIIANGVPATKPAPMAALPKATTPVTKNQPSPSSVGKSSLQTTQVGKNSSAVPPASAKPEIPKVATAKATTLPPAAVAKEQPKEPLPPKPVTGPTKDRIIMAVHDPYWLHVSWELSVQSVQRAEAALKQDWYGAKLIIRLYDVTSQDTTSTSETPIRDIPIESDGSNWWVISSLG